MSLLVCLNVRGARCAPPPHGEPWHNKRMVLSMYSIQKRKTKYAMDTYYLNHPLLNQESIRMGFNENSLIVFLCGFTAENLIL